ncbi:MAG: glutathione S-transferase [Sandarakinorhabdus sp.]|nr:glutathione S-transferase [Sandarakinorhabdus sp.]
MAAELPILYSFRRCPYAMRARMALLASGTACEIREIALGAKPPALIAASPKATVPVLVLADGTVIDESLDIMRWALARADPEDWRGGDDAALIAVNDGSFKHHLDRYKYPDRHGSDAIMHRAAGLDILTRLEARLAAQANLCRDARALTDVAIMPFVRQFARTDPAWFDAQPLPALQAWLARHIASPLFEAAMARHPRWQAGDAPTGLPAYFASHQ